MGRCFRSFLNVAIGGNRPLRKEQMFWTSDGPINEAQLLQMRQEFWDTSPSFEGKKEVWEALRGACEAVEQGDYELAQAIIDGVGVTLPNGLLTQCYDELGNRYVIPKYCLAPPTNLIDLERGIPLPNPGSDGSTAGEVIQMKIRLPTGEDVKLSMRTTDFVRDIKHKLYEDVGIPKSVRVRLLFSGKILTDNSCLNDLKIPKGFLIQAVLSS